MLGFECEMSPQNSVLLHPQQTVLFGKMIDILGGGARGIEDYTWSPVVPACLEVCSLCHTLSGSVLSLERCEQGSLQQQTKAIIPAGTESARTWTSLLRWRVTGTRK